MHADFRLHFLGWHLYRASPWTWPIGATPFQIWPVGSSIGLTDSIPIFAFLFKPLDPLLRRKLIPRERPILVHDLLHLGFDLREIVRRDRCIERDVVVKAIFQRRPVSKLRLRPETLNRFSHDVRGAVAQDEQRIGISVGKDRDLVLAGERIRKINHLIVNLAHDRGLCQPAAD